MKPAAESVDKMVCYEIALQPRPQDDVDFYISAWKHGDPGRGNPELLREDFSGSGMVSILWSLSSPSRRSWAVDFDEEVHAWGRDKHLSKLNDDDRNRVSLVTCDVRQTSQNGVPAVDVVVANNFSWQCFLDDSALREYFTCVMSGLQQGGMFVLDAFGGTSISSNSTEEMSTHDITLPDGRRTYFSYVYEQMDCKPNGSMVIGVSFEFEDDSIIKHAFKYEWRVRPTSNVCSMLREIGFKKVMIFTDWNDSSGLYRHGDKETSEEEWTKRCSEEEYVSCYVVAFK